MFRRKLLASHERCVYRRIQNKMIYYVAKDGWEEGVNDVFTRKHTFINSMYDVLQGAIHGGHYKFSKQLMLESGKYQPWIGYLEEASKYGQLRVMVVVIKYIRDRSFDNMHGQLSYMNDILANLATKGGLREIILILNLMEKEGWGKPSGGTALYPAASCGRIKSVKLVIRKKEKFTWQYRNLETDCINVVAAAAYGGHMRFVKRFDDWIKKRGITLPYHTFA